MNVELRVPDIDNDLVIGNAYQYIEKIDDSIEENSELFKILEEIISLEISMYILGRISGSRCFDQLTPDTLFSIFIEKRNKFKELSGKNYISGNED